MSTTQTTLGSILRGARGDRSKRAAAAEIGVSDTLYGMWEDDYRTPSPRRASELAAFTGLHRAEVLVLLDAITPEEGKLLLGEEQSDIIDGAIPGLRDGVTLTDPTRDVLAAA